jgi:hypothetical protein
MRNIYNKSKSFCLFALIGLLSGCSTIGDISEIKQINYGTLFGMCVGYCKQDVSLKSKTVTYNCSGWQETVQPVTRTEVLKDSVWNAIRLKLNLTTFFNLQEVMGCPDCADGGAEWVEIEMNTGSKHKVTFEYMNEPEALKSCIIPLREIKSFNHCEQ